MKVSLENVLKFSTEDFGKVKCSLNLLVEVHEYV